MKIEKYIKTECGRSRYRELKKDYNKNIVFISRQNSPSLPLSILKGITEAKYENVMWMDADGSMTIIARFKDGGGYKGVTDASKQNIFKAVSIVNKSEDSVIGMLLSIFINKILSFLFKTNLTDLTSGFIILRRNYINEDIVFVSSDLFLDSKIKKKLDNWRLSQTKSVKKKPK